MTDGLSASDVALLSGNNRNDGMFGGDWSAWIILFLLFGLFGNGNGFGFGGNANKCGTPATTADLTTQSIVSKLDGLTNGLADSTYALNNAITGGFSTVQAQMASCCCGIERAIDGVNYNLATQSCDTRNTIQNSTRDILENNNANTRAILDFLVNDKISSLQAENQNLKLQASQATQNAFITANQEAQTAELIRRLAPIPTPAYVVPNPNCCYTANTCGCGTF